MLQVELAFVVGTVVLLLSQAEERCNEGMPKTCVLHKRSKLLRNFLDLLMKGALVPLSSSRIANLMHSV